MIGIAGVGLALAMGAATASSQNPAPTLIHLLDASEKETRREPAPDDDGLFRLVDRVGSAFEAGDSDRLESCLVAGKVYLSLKSRQDESGYYGKSQVRFMFSKLFRERKTDSFVYDSEDVEFTGDESAYVRADWSYIVLDQDDLVTEHLRFKLDRGKNGWSVSEIRTQYR
jgi:hypothetical protein